MKEYAEKLRCQTALNRSVSPRVQDPQSFNHSKILNPIRETGQSHMSISEQPKQISVVDQEMSGNNLEPTFLQNPSNVHMMSMSKVQQTPLIKIENKENSND